MPIILAGLAEGATALFGGAEALGAGLLGAGAAEGAGALGAAELGAGALGGAELGAAGGALALGETVAPALAAEAPFAGIGGGIPFSEAAGVGTEALGGAGTAGAGGTGVIPGATAIPGFPGTAGFSGAEITGATDLATATQPLSFQPAVTGGADIATLPGGPTAAGGGGLDAFAAQGPGIATGPQNAFGGADFGAGAGAGADSGATSFLKSLGVTPIQAAGAAVAGGGLLYNLMQGRKPLPEQAALQGQVAQTNQLLSDFKAGKLPPGYQTAIQQATNAAKATIISNYASRGLPTDPTKNSALAQELAGAERNAVIMTAQIGEKILHGGMEAVGMETGIYETLLKLDVQQSQATGAAIASFASALSGGMRPAGTNITLRAA